MTTPIGQLPNNELISTVAGNLRISSASGTVQLNAPDIYFTDLGAKGIVSLDASSKVTSTALTNGQLMIGSTGNTPIAATLSAGTGINISNSSGAITVSTVGAGFTWNVATTNTALVKENGYVANSVSEITFTLPASAAVGDSFRISGFGTGGWKIVQNSGQRINFGSSLTTTGITGSVASTNQYDAVEIICVNNSNAFSIVSAIGNLTMI